MPDKDFLFFRVLKKDLVRKLQETYPEADQDISAWKGKEILLFQKDLEAQANGRISEKSFYTHFKSGNDKIPRIDVLDLLSQYAGHENWINYKRSKHKTFKTNKTIRWSLGAVFLVIVIMLLSVLIKPKSYSVSIIDAYSNKSIHPDQLKITQLYDDQSPKEIDDKDDTIFTFYTSNDEVKFIVSAPYFYEDTIVRKITHFQKHEIIRLFPNDYALIIHSLSTSENEDWNKRRVQLSSMISENAKIFQFSPSGNIVIEMYNKHEFINKLTIPVNSLKNIDIIDVRYENELISELRFVQEKGGINE
jgi:hypothetical protein